MLGAPDPPLDPADIEAYARRFDHLVLRPTKKGVALFRCPMCGSTCRNDATLMPPMCTGPNWSDDHEFMEMVLVEIVEAASVTPGRLVA